MTEKDAVYMIRERRTRTLTILYMDNEFPLKEEQQRGLDKLAHVSDLFLIFNDKLNLNSNRVDKMKFACLHDCMGWIDTKNTVSETLMKLFEYTFLIKEASSFYYYTLVNCSGLDKLDEKVLINLRNYHTSNMINQPIVNIRRLSPKELLDIYKTEPIDQPRKLTFKDIFKRINIKPLSDKFDYTNSFSTHTTDSWIIPMKVSTVNSFLDYYKKEGTTPYVDSFKWNDLRYFISSLMIKLGLSYKDLDFCSIKIEGNVIKEE
jgi:hypothetical protein